MADPIEFRVPPTTAHLGPGFGVLGLALDLGLRVRLSEHSEKTQVVVRTDSDTDQPLGQRHDSIWRGLQTAAETFKIKLPPSLCLEVEGDLPRGCGLGSNTAEFAAGIAAAVRHAKQPPSDHAILNLLDSLGGDPAHGAASLRGGLAAAIPVHAQTDHRAFRLLQYPMHADWRFVVVAPAVQLGTADLHRVLPPTMPHASSRRTAGRLAGLICALATGDVELLGDCIIDEIHVPFRQRLAPGIAAAMSAARDAGAAGATISGHGPAVVALSTDRDACDAIATAIAGAFQASNLESETIICGVAAQGALP